VAIETVILAVAGEMYAGERCTLAVPVFGIVIVKRTLLPLALPPAPDGACGTDELAPPPAQPAMSATPASSKNKRYLRYIMMHLH
jgi:hypothetical protein